MGKAGIAVLSLITSKLLATYLMVSERGQYDYVYGLLGVVGILADMGLYTIAIREISKDESNMERIIGNILSIRNLLVILTVAGTFAYLYLTSLFFGSEVSLNFYIALLFASVSMMVTLLNGTITSVLQVKYSMRHATISQILGKFLIIVVMAISMVFFFQKPDPGYLSATPFWGYHMLFVAGIIGNLCMYWYTRYHVSKYVTIRYRFDFAYWKELIREALPYGFAIMLGTIYFKIDLLIIRMMYADPLVADTNLGYYAAPVKVLDAFTTLPLFFLNALLPLLTLYLKDKDPRLNKMLQYSFDFLVLLAAPMVAGGVALGYQIINATNSEVYLSRLQDGFIGSDVLLQILICTLLFSFVNLLFNFLLMSVGKQKVLIIVNAVCLLFNVIGNVLFIPYFGLVACAVVTVLTELLVLILTFGFSKKYVDYHISPWRSLRILAIAAMLFVVLWVTKDPVTAVLGNDIGVLALTVLGAGLYLGLIFLFRVVNQDMLRLIKKNA